MSSEGIHDVYLTEGTVNGERFEEFIRSVLWPILQPFNWVNHHSVVFMDNVAIHDVEGVIDLIENQAKARLIFLPPYSPDLNPIEEVFSQVKSIMKQNDALFKVYSSPRTLLSMAFSMVSKSNFQEYIHHEQDFHVNGCRARIQINNCVTRAIRIYGNIKKRGMPVPYSNDLRWRILCHSVKELNPSQISDLTCAMLYQYIDV